MADFALVAPEDCYHSSVGACIDAFALVRDHIGQLFAEGHRTRMETGLRVLTLDGQPARTGDGRTIAADGGIDDDAQYDLVHIAGFRLHGLRQLDERLAAARPFLDWLRRQHDGGALIASSGAATFLVAAAGLVDALPVPLPRAMVSLARQRFPRMVIDERRAIIEHGIEHGRIVMGCGLAADQALMVRLIERTISAETGHWLAAVIGIDHDVEDLSQDPLIANAQLWLEQRFAHDVRIADLAVAMATSHQTLIRRFVRDLGVRPKDYVQRLRIRAAAQMLHKTSRSVDQVAATVGYRDTRSFRAVFRAQMGMTATAYRAVARGAK